MIVYKIKGSFTIGYQTPLSQYSAASCVSPDFCPHDLQQILAILVICISGVTPNLLCKCSLLNYIPLLTLPIIHQKKPQGQTHMYDPQETFKAQNTATCILTAVL